VLNHRHYLLPVPGMEDTYYPAGGLGTAITVLPAFVVAHVFFGVNLLTPSTLLFLLSKLCAAALVAGAVVWLWCLLSLFMRQRYALLLTLTYAFGTSTCAMTTQALTPHAPFALYVLCVCDDDDLVFFFLFKMFVRCWSFVDVLLRCQVFVADHLHIHYFMCVSVYVWIHAPAFSLSLSRSLALSLFLSLALFLPHALSF
jgi:hypothetical protein